MILTANKAVSLNPQLRRHSSMTVQTVSLIMSINVNHDADAQIDQIDFMDLLPYNKVSLHDK